jgi:hypothetical protein
MLYYSGVCHTTFLPIGCTLDIYILQHVYEYSTGLTDYSACSVTIHYAVTIGSTLCSYYRIHIMQLTVRFTLWRYNRMYIIQSQ